MIVRKALELYISGDEKYSHLEKADMEKVGWAPHSPFNVVNLLLLDSFIFIFMLFFRLKRLWKKNLTGLKSIGSYVKNYRNMKTHQF